jgi:phasin family protein
MTGEKSMNDDPSPVAPIEASPLAKPGPLTLAGDSETSVPKTPLTATLKEGMHTMINNSKELIAFGEGNLEAFAAASKIWVAGVQDLTKQVAETAKASLEESVATAKALTSVKSVKEAIDLQSTYSKAAVAKALAESSKLTEASLKLTEQTLAPITARIAVAVDTFSKAA